MFLVFLMACPGDKNGELVNGPSCADTPTVVALDEVTPLGFAAAALATLADGAHEAPLDWVNRPDSTLTVSATLGSEARYVDSEAVYPDDGTYTAIGVVCDDRVEIDSTLEFGTADGELAETWAVVLSGTTADAVGFHHDIDLDGLTGTYDILEDTTAVDYTALKAWADGSFDAAGTSGTLSGQASGGEPCEEGQTCTAWAENIDIATWGVPSTR